MHRLALAFIMLLGCAPLPSDIAPADDAALVGDAAADASRPTANEDAAVADDRSSPEPVDGASTDTYARVHAIFERSCGGYCHAGGVDVGSSLVLAPEDGSAPMLMGRASRQVPRLRLITPGDPDASYLMRKIDGTMSAVPECASDRRRCGVPMPYQARAGAPVVLLSVAERDLIRRWIADGAPGADTSSM